MEMSPYQGKSLSFHTMLFLRYLWWKRPKRPAHLLVEQPKFALKKAAQGGEKRDDANSHQKKQPYGPFFSAAGLFF